MANIILTSYCNLHCPYCFANKMIETEKQKNITIEQLKKSLDWIGEEDMIGLIGGEPTLHPEFDKILETLTEYSKKRKSPHHFVLFTNGIYLGKYIQKMPQNMRLLININEPKSMTTEQYSNMIKNLTTLWRMGWLGEGGRVTLGCNICKEIDNYQFFWDIIKKFQPPAVRFSVVAPTKKEQLENKENYYQLMKNKFLHFVNNALKYKTLLSPDCNRIPSCFFSDEELITIKKACVPENQYEDLKCSPVVDIALDFTATSCFGCFQRIDCKNFDNLEEAKRYMIFKVMQPKIMNNNDGKCANCEKFEYMKCQGGCLAFSKKH